MISKELAINVTSSEITIALLEDKQLVELRTEKNNPDFSGKVGDIYIGKVRKIVPNLNAAFVELGYERDAFLHYTDLGPQFTSLHDYLQLALSNRKNKTMELSKFKLKPDINKHGKMSEVIKVGQMIVVQIAKEPIQLKGPRISSEISIAGRYLVLMPFSDKVSISQKIKTNDEKQRLRKLINSIKPVNYGVIVRTVAEGKNAAILDAELRDLVRKWEKTFASLHGQLKPPKRIIGELSQTTATLRDLLNAEFHTIYINDQEAYKEVRSYISDIAPEKEKIVKYFNGRVPMFDQLGINKQVKALFGKTVTIKGGAYLIIEHTEALHVIDVNSGNRSKKSGDQESNALDVNMVAADEIARQLRLRDMGGIIVVDFIDMYNGENRNKLHERMKQAMANDRTRHNILPLSRFGLMQITRQRVRPEMNIKTSEKCPVCKGTGKVSSSILLIDEIENNLRYILDKKHEPRITLKAHPFVAAYLNQGTYSLKMKWWFKYKVRIKVLPIQAYHFLEYYFFNRNDEKIK